MLKGAAIAAGAATIAAADAVAAKPAKPEKKAYGHGANRKPAKRHRYSMPRFHTGICSFSPESAITSPGRFRRPPKPCWTKLRKISNQPVPPWTRC